MATVSTQSVTTTGGALTYSAASGGGDRFTPGSTSFMHVVNGSGSSINVTITTPGTVDGLAISDRVIAVPAGVSRIFKVTSELYASADGLGDVAWSAVTSITFAVCSM